MKQRSVNLGTYRVGQRVKVGLRGNAADLATLSAWTLSGNLFLNGAGPAIVGVPEWYAAPNADGFIGSVAFPDTALSAAGYFEGTITLTKADDTASPDIESFAGKIEAVP
jgi:hypothetical protein